MEGVTLLNSSHSVFRQKPHMYRSGECHNLVLLRSLSSAFAKLETLVVSVQIHN